MIRVDPARVTTAPAPPTGGGLDARALIEGRLAMLTRLAEIGMEIAEAAGRQATGRADADAPPMRDPGLVYARVARAVRLTVALQSRLMDDLAGLGRAAEAAQAERRRRLERLVERAVEAGQAESDETGSRLDEARERLDEADLDAEIDGLSFAAVVARICADLGLPPDRAARIVAAAGADDAPPTPPWPAATVVAGLFGDPVRPAARPRAPPG